MSEATNDGNVVEKGERRPSIYEHDVNREELPPAPDGGYGWIVTFGSFLSILLMGGLQFCWCVIVERLCIMQDYYEREVFGKTSSVTVQLSLVGTLVTIMMYLFALPTGVMYNVLGAKIPLYVGTIMASGGLLAASTGSQIWHLYLSMSICSGIGISILNNIYLRVLPYWFDKKRNIAFGIYGSSQPFAGLVIPFIITPVNNNLGAPWTFRVLGLVFLAINLAACIIVKEAPGGMQARKSEKKLRFNYKTFLEPNVILWLFQGPIHTGCMLIPYTFIPSYATYIGLSDTQGSAIISVMCAMGFIGRIGIGFLADRLGRLNTLILTTTVSGLSCILIWMFANSFGTLIAYGVVYGLFSGGYNSVFATVAAFLVGMDRYPIVLSVGITACALGSLGITMASAIEAASSAAPFLTYKLMTGLGYFLSVTLLLILRLRLDRTILSKI